MITSITLHEITEQYCIANNKFAVRIVSDEYELLYKEINECFDANVAQSIIDNLSIANIILFDDKNLAISLFSILNKDELNDDYYACLYGPDGTIDVNT